MAMSVTYTTFNGTIVHENRGGVERAYVPDTLGSTQALIDDTETVTDTWEYWPYGEVSQRTGTNPTPFTFVGMLGYFKDLLDRLLYVRARYLRIDLARWLTVDPLWPDQPAYMYAGTVPTSRIDPTGLVCQASNPCSSLRGTEGACVAALCSFKNVADMLKSLLAGTKDPKLQDLIKKLLKDLKDRPVYSPEECCRLSKGGGSLRAIRDVPTLFAYICSIAGGIKMVYMSCANRGFEREDDCYKCCDEIDKTRGQINGLCRNACQQRHKYDFTYKPL